MVKTNYTESDIATAQAVMNIQRAYKSGKLHAMRGQEDALAEIMNAPTTPFGSIDIDHMPPKIKATARALAAALKHLTDPLEREDPSQTIDVPAAQRELFGLFENLFAGLVGCPHRYLTSEDNIKPLMLQRIERNPSELYSQANAAGDQLSSFYAKNGVAFFRYAQLLGGVKLVSGGQRAFTGSALNALRISGLYADTQLVPDPIFPYTTGKLDLNAQPLQLALVLFHVLSLTPLVFAKTTTPPVFLFPSFEEYLNENDAHTIRGQEELSLSLLKQACDGTFSSISEVMEYAIKHEEKFVTSVLNNRLFIPPGFSPNQHFTRDEAVRGYLDSVQGYRKEEHVAELRMLPTGLLMFNGVVERIAPQYHLLENASELNAQPLLHQETHWHYFEKCAHANTVELVRKEVLSEQAFQNLRAVHDRSLAWLANIPIEALAAMIEAGEHRWLRDELGKFTTQLAAAKTSNLEATVREVRHGLDSIVQRQTKAMREIEKKYEPKKWQALAGTGTALAVAGTATMLPMLAPTLGAVVPAVAATTALLLGTRTFIQEKVGEIVEKRQARSSMVGILAAARKLG
jgi:hypothetical protein